MFTKDELHDMFATMLVDATVGKRGDESKALQMEVKDLPLASIRRVFEYGFQRYCNDKCGGSDKTLADKIETVKGIFDDLRKGHVTRRNAVGETADPMSKFRVAALREMYNAKHGARAFAELSKRDDAGDIIAKLLERNAEKIEKRAEELRAEAERAAKLKAKAVAELADAMDLNI